MLLLEEMQTTLEGCTFEVIATDLNDRSLATAREGIYSSHSTRNVPPDLLEKYFTKTGPDFRVADSVRPFVSFSRINLVDDCDMRLMRESDLIFCCNALIYFDRRSKIRTTQHFYDALRPGGYFFLGPCESLFGLSHEFRLVHFPGATAYWKAGNSAEWTCAT
jgi:chemotaxis protein methyltransferase CheR